MKKFLIVFILLLGIINLCACSNSTDTDILNSTSAIDGTQDIITKPSGENASDEGEKTANTTKPASISEVITTASNRNSQIEYVPGSIKLLNNDYYDKGIYRPYRLAYYRIPGEIGDLVPEDDYMKWAEQHFWGNPFDLDEMGLVKFVKHFNISKSKFDSALNAMRNNPDMNTNEEFEIPNSDVIYTFDNDLINHYYRYE